MINVAMITRRSRGYRAWRLAPLLALLACGRRGGPPPGPDRPPQAGTTGGTAKVERPVPAAPWLAQPVLQEGEVFGLLPGGGRVMPEAEARAAGLLVVDLSDAWVPFIFSEGAPIPPANGASADGGAAVDKPNPYRHIFTALANDRVSPDMLYLRGEGPTRARLAIPADLSKKQREEFEKARDERLTKALRRLGRKPIRNYLEPYGILPTLSVLLTRLDDDVARGTCYAAVDLPAFLAFSTLGGAADYQTAELSRRQFEQVDKDRVFLAAEVEKRRKELTAAGAYRNGTGTPEELDGLAAVPGLAPLVTRLRVGEARTRAVTAVQRRLLCEGFLDPTVKLTEGVFDLATHEALAAWERKNDIFSWGILGGETLALLQRPAAELHLQTFRRIITERVVDAAGIIEDESLASGGGAPTYRNAEGKPERVRDLVGEHRDALQAALGVRDVEQLAGLLRALSREGLARLRVAFPAPALPPYYRATPGIPAFEINVVIDRGDVWYDFPFDDEGKAAEQPRYKYPSLTVQAAWNGQQIPLARWRTTIGSWRSEVHPDGNLYYRYKNSDVGPRIWKHIIASPVWVPPDGTPGKDLLTRKKFEPHAAPETVVNTEVMGPGFNSAYGLVMAIHHEVKPGGHLFDNQIRTHGSVDYTSIARRYSHGCHRLVNLRAVRLFGFALQRTPFDRSGDQKLGFAKVFTHEGQEYRYDVGSRGYAYKLLRPIKVEVLEGRVRGKRLAPIEAFVRKPGVDYAAIAAGVAGGLDEPEGEGNLPAGVAESAPPEPVPTGAPAGSPVDALAAPAPPPPPIIDAEEARKPGGKKVPPR